MATLKPRITITLDEHAHEVLRRLSAAGGNSMSAVVTDFLDVALPAMERMVVVLEQAKSANDEAKAAVRGSLDRAEAALLPTVTEAMANLNLDLFITGVARAPHGWSEGEEAAFREKSAAVYVREQAAKVASDGEAERRQLRPRSGRLTPVPVTRGSGRSKGTSKAKNHG